MNLVDEMFSRFRVKPKGIVDRKAYTIALSKLYMEGYVSLTELLEYMEPAKAYNTLYVIAKQLFPYIGIMVERPTHTKKYGEIILFTNITRASKQLCKSIDVNILESLTEILEKKKTEKLKKNTRYKAHSMIEAFIEVCRRELEEKVGVGG